MRTIWVWAMAAGLALAAWGSGSAYAVPTRFAFADLEGKPATVQAAPAQDKELVVFWGTWCTDCRAKLKGELPEFARQSGVNVVTVNLDTDLARAKHYVQREGISLPVYTDPSSEFRKSLGVYSVPHWAAYRRDAKEGWVLVKSAPAFDWVEVRKALGI